MMALPDHLKKYIVEQNYEKYTPVDQACWRYVLRQLKSFLSQHAHECYLEGLEKTGIEIDRIPHIEQISKKLEKFGWRALPVSGFIPPAAFMELQSLGVLPIASDMRTLEHLSYTPAPDIVHEAAGHAPILIHPDFANYLKEYAQIAKMALISKEDLDLYEAIRVLSDLKENPTSTPEQIQAAQKKLETTADGMSHVSEAAELSRMNWWTAEYGLIGDLKNPKIFGAGLLSSVGESKWCLSDKVKKLPLTVDCIQQSYDITEPQPQLFVAADFKELSQVLEKMAEKMAYRTGGPAGLEKAILAQTVNSAELNSGLQISGIFSSSLVEGQELIYLKTTGPTQLSFQNQELPGHSKEYHRDGFSTLLGGLKATPQKCLSTYSAAELEAAGLRPEGICQLEFSSGIVLNGKLKGILIQNKRNLIFTFEKCTVKLAERILFDPSWGTFDLAPGLLVTSVFAGPADRLKYGLIDDFATSKVKIPEPSQKQKELYQLYQKIRNLRERAAAFSEFQKVFSEIQVTYPLEWLAALEIYEYLKSSAAPAPLCDQVRAHLLEISRTQPSNETLIRDGLKLADQDLGPDHRLNN